MSSSKIDKLIDKCIETSEEYKTLQEVKNLADNFEETKETKETKESRETLISTIDDKKKKTNEKKKNKLSIKVKLSLFAVIIIIGLILIYYFTPVEYTLKAPDVTITYGEQIPIDDFCIIKHKILDEKIPVSGNMIIYDRDIIGSQKAVFKYEKEDVIEQVTFQLTINPIQLSNPVITFSDDKIFWNTVENAAGYMISINGELIDTEDTEFSVAKYNTGARELDIKVKACTNNKRYSDSDFSNSINVPKLMQVSDVQYKNGKIKWSAVDGVKEYAVLINGIEYRTSVTELAFQNFIGGNNKVEIMALSEKSEVASSSYNTTFFRKLQEVENIRNDKEGLHWDSQERYCKYNVVINGTEYEAFENYYKYTFVENVSYKVKITAIPLDPTVIESDTIEYEVFYKKLNVPEVSILLGSYKNCYALKIQPVENADSYKVEIQLFTNGIESKKEYTIYSLEKDFEVESTVDKIVVKVIALDSTGLYGDSDFGITERRIK